MQQAESHHLQGNQNDKLAYGSISAAKIYMEMALKHLECPLCRADAQLIYDALVEVEKISAWAAHNNESSVGTIRKLALELDKLHMLGFLVTVYKYLRHK